MNNIKSLINLIVSIYRPDFRKTAGWVCITSGLVLVAPNFVHEIILHLLQMHGFVEAGFFENSRSIGGVQISIGIHYHLLYIAAQSKQRKLEVVCALSLLCLIPVMIYLTF